MWIKRLILFIFGLLPIALAGSGELTPRDVLATVLDVVRADWNGDGLLDRAVLWQPQEGGRLASLYVFMSGAKAVYEVSGVAWSSLGGYEVRLERDPHGFSVLSGGSAGGKTWREGLAVAFVDGEPRVTGYSYSVGGSPDAAEFSCNADFLAGRGSRNGEPFAISGGAPPLLRWSFNRIPPPCKAH
jgi:hypothetical protein